MRLSGKRILVAKPGLDGHDAGAKVITLALRNAGAEVIYTGLRRAPDYIARVAVAEDVDAVGLSILSGSHIPLVEDLMERMRAEGLGNVPVVVGGIIPDEDARRLRAMGVAKVYTPKDFVLNTIMMDIVALVDSKAVAAE